MIDLLPVIDSLMKLALVIGAMVWIATAPSGTSATAVQAGAWSANETDEWSPAFSDDDSSDHDFEHTVNIDGTPMLGDTDIYGNAFGVTDDWHTNSCGCGGMSSSMFD